MRKLIHLLMLLILSGCVLQSDYDKLKTEKIEIEEKVNNLEDELSKVKHEYEQLLEEKRQRQKQAEIEKTKKKYYSEEQAMRYVKDYYSFYESDKIYRNIRLRRIDNNSFKVSIETCTSKGNFSNDDFFWSAWVYNLVIHSDGTYAYTMSF